MHQLTGFAFYIAAKGERKKKRYYATCQRTVVIAYVLFKLARLNIKS